MKKPTLVLAGIVIVLIIFLLVLTHFLKPKSTVERGDLESSLTKLDTLTVTQIQIKKQDGVFTFNKSGDQWIITSPIEYKANQSFVRQMLHAFVDLRVEDKRTDNPEKHTKFEVDTTGTEVTFLTEDKGPVALIIGKTSQDYSHTFVREKDSDDVYSVKGILSGQLNRNLDSWRDKTIFKADKTDITQLALVYPEETITLYWMGGNWTISTGEMDNVIADQQTVDQMLNTLSNFRASLFPGEEEYAEVNFDKPDFRIDLTTIDGTTVLRMVEEKEQNRFFVHKEGDATIFQVYRGTVANLMKKVDDLKAKEEESPSAGEPTPRGP